MLRALVPLCICPPNLRRSCLDYAAYLIMIVLATAPAAAQQGQNIAGTYRGLMTSCFSQARSSDCRKGFIELIRMADEVDAKRVEWERAAAAGGALSSRMNEDYAQAIERLNRAVSDFNRDMSAAVPEARLR
jgi:hypothetical protein